MRFLEAVEVLYFRKPWTEEEVEDAARGMVHGSCGDSPDVMLQFWWEIARWNHEGSKLRLEGERLKLLVDYLRNGHERY